MVLVVRFASKTMRARTVVCSCCSGATNMQSAVRNVSEKVRSPFIGQRNPARHRSVTSSATRSRRGHRGEMRRAISRGIRIPFYRSPYGSSLARLVIDLEPRGTGSASRPRSRRRSLAPRSQRTQRRITVPTPDLSRADSLDLQSRTFNRGPKNRWPASGESRAAHFSARARVPRTIRYS